MDVLDAEASLWNKPSVIKTSKHEEQSRMPHRHAPAPLPTDVYSRSTPQLPTLRALNLTLPIPKQAGVDEAREDDERGRAAGDDERGRAAGAAVVSESEDSQDDSDHDTLDNLPEENSYRPGFSRSSTYLGPASFAPPFYNRPPTPLPPSPSLTSLLRPNFSAATSRPGTPDPSSDEGGLTTPSTTTTAAAAAAAAAAASAHSLPAGAQTPNSAAATTLSSSFRTAKPIPRASPKVPTYEYYGFTLYLTSSLAFLIYLLWSFLPSPFLHQLGIYYYPNRWWSLAIPAWLVMLVVWVFVALASYNTGTLTLEMTDLGCLVDDAANIAVVDTEGRIVRAENSWASGVKSGGGAAAAAAASATTSAAASTSAVSGLSFPAKQKHRKTSPRPVDKMVGDSRRELDWTSLWNEGTDAVLDVPIGGVCELLYGRPDDGEYESS